MSEENESRDVLERERLSYMAFLYDLIRSGGSQELSELSSSQPKARRATSPGELLAKDIVPLAEQAEDIQVRIKESRSVDMPATGKTEFIGVDNGFGNFIRGR